MTARIYTVRIDQTPRRDIDLFGPTTVRIDAAREPGGAGVPLIYLSAYVTDAEAFAQRMVAALAWLDDSQHRPHQSQALPPMAGEAPNKPSPEVGPYSLPDFVEDVDWDEVLFLPEDLTTTDWKAWSGAISRRVDLATTSGQLAALECANAMGLRACPGRFRAPLGRSLHARYVETGDQAAA